MAYSDNSELASEESLQQLARLTKILESLGVADSAQRQRLAIDMITSGLTLATITTVGTITTVSAQTTLAGMDREMYINQSRITHANAIRNQLT